MTKQIKFPKTVLTILAMLGLALLLTAGLGAPVSAAPANEPATGLHTEMHDETGVLILSVVPDSPADRAGITRGDIVLAVDDQAIDGVETFAEAIGALAAGDEIVITVEHGDDTLELSTILGERNGRTYLGVLPYAGEAVSEDEANAEETDEAAEDAVEDDASDEADEAEEDNIAKRRSGRPMMPLAQGGAMISDVVEGGPADEAGLVAGDLIVSVDGEELSEGVDFAEMIGSHAPGDEVSLTVTNFETSEKMEIPVVLGAHPDDDERAFLGIAYAFVPAFPNMGDVAPDDDSDNGTDEDGDGDSDLDADEAMMPFGQVGALIADVLEGSPADEAGLVAGDLIIAVDDEELGEDVDFAEMIGSHAPGDEVLLTVTNVESNETISVPVTLGAHPEDAERAFLGLAYALAPVLPGMADVAPDEHADDTDEDADMPEDDGGEMDDNEAVEESDEADDDAAPRGRHSRSGMPSGHSSVKVAEVVEDSPAAEVGLVVGDLIVAVDGEELGPGVGLGDLLGVYAPGDEVELTIRNADSDGTMDLSVTLGAHPDDEERAFLGIAYMPILNRARDSRYERPNVRPEQHHGQEPQDKDGDGCFHDHHDESCEGHHDGEGYGHDEDGEGHHGDGYHSDGEHGGMMMPFFHHGMGGHGLEDFDFDQLSEEDLEALQEMFPFLFPDEEE